MDRSTRAFWVSFVVAVSLAYLIYVQPNLQDRAVVTNTPTPGSSPTVPLFTRTPLR